MRTKIPPNSSDPGDFNPGGIGIRASGRRGHSGNGSSSPGAKVAKWGLLFILV